LQKWIELVDGGTAHYST